jgi:hypothetical protein
MIIINTHFPPAVDRDTEKVIHLTEDLIDARDDTCQSHARHGAQAMKNRII